MTKRTRYFMAGSAAVMAAGLCTGLIAYYGGGFQALSASTGPTELQYVPADASVIAYADVRSIMDSEFRQRLKENLPIPQDDKAEFQDKTGIDIERDIDYVVAAMTAADASHPNGLVVARGRFDIVKLEGLAREHGGAVEDYRGKRLLNATHGDSEHGGTLAFLEPGLVAIGTSTAVRRAIDAQLSGQSITANDDMMELVSDIERANNAWAVGRFDALTSQAKLPDQVASRIPAVRYFAAAGHINGGVSGIVRAEAIDEKSAEDLRQVVNGLLALARLQGQNDPKIQAVAQSLQLSGTGTTVALSFTVPAELLQLVAPKAPEPAIQ
ncbi:MAG TPA: hypothetical protein VD833_21205 [Vicinamibacterales bacterium]|nr:hypothetical protein [Vicinamibacterales bacterium]